MILMMWKFQKRMTLADPNQGPNGDPDNDGLTNQDESALGNDPQRADTDNDV